MPSFCRHNRLVQNCPICAREQAVEMRPVLTPGGRPEPRPRPATPARVSADGAAVKRPGRAPTRGSRGGMTVRRLARHADDGYASDLVPGVRSVADAERLADEIAFAATRLQVLAVDPPGLYAEVAHGEADLEERTWLAFEIAFISPRDVGHVGHVGHAEDGEDPFAAVRRARRSWASGDAPALPEDETGPRDGGDATRAQRTSDAYHAWAQRLGSQAMGLQGEPAWSAQRRFDRAFERLGSLASMDRGPRYELLVTLGRLGVYEMRASRLHLGGSDPVTLAAKRILGIGDPLLLERRAADLAESCGLPIEALDLGLFNWERGARYTGGLPAQTAADPGAVASARAALALD
jgi:hypothetical protein